MDGDLETGISLPLPSADSPQWVQLEFPKPCAAGSLTIFTGHGRQNHAGRPESSDDGKSFKPVCKFQIPPNGINPSILGTGFPVVSARFFRVVFDRPAPKSKGVLLQELVLSSDARLENWPGKAGYTRAVSRTPEQRADGRDRRRLRPPCGVRGIAHARARNGSTGASLATRRANDSRHHPRGKEFGGLSPGGISFHHTKKRVDAEGINFKNIFADAL